MIKKIVEETQQEIRIVDDIEFGFIYATRHAGNVYVLVYAGPKNLYAFVPLNTDKDALPLDGSSNMIESVQNAMDKGYTVYEIGSEKEFADWLRNDPEKKPDTPLHLLGYELDSIPFKKILMNKQSGTTHRITKAESSLSKLDVILVIAACGVSVEFDKSSSKSLNKRWLLTTGNYDCATCKFSGK